MFLFNDVLNLMTACSRGQTETSQGPRPSLTVTSSHSPCLPPRQPCSSTAPVKVKLVGQHPPVIPPGLRRIQAATQLLSDGDGDAEGIGPHQRGDVTGRVQQRRINTLGILQKERGDRDYTSGCTYIIERHLT